MEQQLEPSGPVVGPDVVLPGSEQLTPGLFAVLALLAGVVVVVGLVVRHRRSRRDDRRRPLVTVAAGVIAVLAIAMAAWTWPPAFSSPEFPPVGQLFPEAAFFHRPIDDLEVHPDSERWMGSTGGMQLVAGFGGEPVDGVVFGVPFNPVDDTTPRTDVRFRSPGDDYEGPYPVTDPAYIESMPTYGFDNHYVALDLVGRSMWELIGTVVWFGTWEADSGARWDLDSLEYGGPSTIVAGLPLLPGAVSYDEVAAGSVDHMVWGAGPFISSERVVWPALATDGLGEGPDAPPMGSWLRLRDDADLSELGPQARVIAEGLQRHGLLLADTTLANFTFRGTPDARWDRNDLRTLRSLTTDDFEVVDHLGLMVSPDSMAAEPRS